MLKFNLKKTVAVLSTVVLPLAASADACGGGSGKADKAPVVVCKTAGYHKASFKEKRAKGVFLTCGPKGTKNCKITINMPSPKGGSDYKIYRTITDRSTFTIPNNAKSWGNSNCDGIYKKNQV